VMPRQWETGALSLTAWGKPTGRGEEALVVVTMFVGWGGVGQGWGELGGKALFNKVISTSSKVMGAEAVTPRQRETGALSVTCMGKTRARGELVVVMMSYGEVDWGGMRRGGWVGGVRVGRGEGGRRGRRAVCYIRPVLRGCEQWLQAKQRRLDKHTTQIGTQHEISKGLPQWLQQLAGIRGA